MPCSGDQFFDKHSYDVLDIEIDMTRFFAGTTDFLSSGSVTITGNDSVLQSGGGGHGALEFFGPDLQKARAWFSDGTPGVVYKAEIRLVSDDGRQKEIEIYVTILPA